MNSKRLSIGLLFLSSSLFAGGYEKPSIWSAKWTGLAGAAAARVTGADAVLFNPAGVAHGKMNHEVSLNLSPATSKFEGPAVVDNRSEVSDRQFAPILGLLYRGKINKNSAIGVSFYTAGGAVSEYNDIDFSDVVAGAKGNMGVNVNFFEAAIAYSYKVNKNISLGAAWRASLIMGDLEGTIYNSTLTSNLFGNTIIKSKISEFEDWDYSGYRLGVKYLDDSKKWGLGATFRSSVDFAVKGTGSGSLASASVGGTDANRDLVGADDNIVKNTFPWKMTIGSFFKINPKNIFHIEYAFAKYSENEIMEVSGTLKLNAGLGGTNLLANGAANIPQYWDDYHSIMVGHEYRLTNKLPFRFGFSWSSQVVPDSTAKNTFTAPGPSLGYYIGTGYRINKTMDFNFAVDYITNSGSSGGHSVATKSADSSGNKLDGFFLGDFKAQALTAHLSLNLFF